MNKVCITGDKGFIGHHLAMYLAVKGYEVIGYDLVDGKDVRFMKPQDLDGIKYVFHLAAKAKVPYSIQHPQETYEHNVNGTLNVLRCSAKAGVKRVVFSSSSSVYGNQEKLPISENSPCLPLSPYGLQKLISEEHCRIFAEYGLEVVSLRYFNVYGEEMPQQGEYTAMIANFLNLAKYKKFLPIYGGRQTRDFTYVGDVCEANLAAALSNKVGKGEIINIGGGKNYSIKEVADLISPYQTIYPQRNGEPMNTLADIKKAKELLNWQPKVNLKQWLKSLKK